MRRTTLTLLFVLAAMAFGCSSTNSGIEEVTPQDITQEDQAGRQDLQADLAPTDQIEQDLAEPDQAQPDVQADVEDTQQPSCGDGTCGAGEDPCSCPDDCLLEGEIGQPCCQDSDCLAPACGPCCVVECQDHVCVSPVPPGPCCWNGQCEEGETFETCPEDCPQASCGDGACNGSENPCDCPIDCMGDGNVCCTDYDCPPLNCGPCCMLKCEDYQCSTEPVWLEQCCFNGACETGESLYTCPADCSCGNGTCDAGEDVETCDADCDKPANQDPNCDPADPVACGVATGRTMVTIDGGMMPGVSQPYIGVLIEAFSGDTLVASALSSDVGDYKLTLYPGEYKLVATPPSAEDEWAEVMPPFAEQNITVTAGGNTITDFDFFYSGMVVDKPNIYLYPTTTQQVQVTLQFSPASFLTISIPEYGQGWDVTAEPSGILDGEWGFLFYEAAVGGGWQTQAGHNVPAESLEAWMYQTLPLYGLNAQETFDFADFWKSALPAADWYTFYPQWDEAISNHVGLTVTPAPDSLLRLWFLVVPGDTPKPVAEPFILPFDRSGFSVVEWGVIVG